MPRIKMVVMLLCGIISIAQAQEMLTKVGDVTLVKEDAYCYDVKYYSPYKETPELCAATINTDSEDCFKDDGDVYFEWLHKDSEGFGACYCCKSSNYGASPNFNVYKYSTN